MADKKAHTGLSPSSLTLFQSCNRKYYYKKIANLPPDSDAPEDTEALDIGKAFHKVLEDTKHELAGTSAAKVMGVVKAHNLDEVYHFPLIFAMLGSYRKMHEKAGLKAIHCEIEIETEVFYGFVDVILQGGDGSWWIGDMKTAASYSATLLPTLSTHQQLNLYAHHAPVVAASLGLKIEDYRGCRYRLTTKSKLVRKADEGFESYVGRLSKAIKSIDFILPKEILQPQVTYDNHTAAFDFIESRGDNVLNYPQNPGNCVQYFRPCEHWSKCWGKLFSEAGSGVDFVEG